MNCPVCQTENPEGAKFCFNCGAATSVDCPNCGTQLPANARFCFNCGHQLAAPASEPESGHGAGSLFRQYMPQELAAKLEEARASQAMAGERRIVTILFCDVAGSTALAEQFDPEEWAGIMNEAFQYLIEPVYRYEGTVARLMGDAILAFFGAPIAHEDDAQRAVLAGLEIVRGIQDFRTRLKTQHKVDFNVRIGVNTGLVVVGAVGSDLQMEYTAMGDAVNLAARMEQTAAPGVVQIAESTYRLVASLFEVEPVAEIEVKGKSESVQAYRVIRERPGAVLKRGIEGLWSPLVGREEHIQTLMDRFESLLEGHGHIVSVVGEAGIGKSRLLAEYQELILRRPREEENPLSTQAAPLWLEGRSFSYETSTPFAPFVDVFNTLFELEHDQTDTEKLQAIKTKLDEMGSEQLVEDAPFLATLLGVPLSGKENERVRYLEPPVLRERIFQSVGDLVERLSERQLVILIFEDLHWIDRTSLELLEQLISLTDRRTLLIVCLFRPNREDLSWSFHEYASRELPHRYAMISLEPLDEGQSRQLVSNLLHIEDLPETVRELILRKAEGNPFYVEEVIRSLLDTRMVVRENSHWRATRDIVHINVPDTLVGVITSRLDRLDRISKRVTQTAAVIGREFPYDLLDNVYENPDRLEKALSELQRRELVREKSRYPQRTYLFKHVLTQETAYNSLLMRKRKELHLRVAESLERLYPESVYEIALHFLEAQAKTRAYPYLIDAGDQALRAYSIAEAVSYYQQALLIVSQVDDLALARRVYEGLGRALTLANDVPAAVEHYQEMYRFAKEHGDIPIQVSALNKLSNVLALWMGEFPEAEKLLLDAERLAKDYGDRHGLAETLMTRCGLCTATGDFEGAVNYLSESVELGRDLNEKEQMALGLTHIANTQTFMTQFEEAWATAQEGLKITQEVGNRELLAEILAFSVPMVHMRNGDLETARQVAGEGVRIAAQIGVAFPESDGSYILGLLAHLQGNYQDAIHWLQRAHQSGKASRMVFMEAVPLCRLGTVYLDISEKLLDRTRQLHNEALALMEMPGGHMAGGFGWFDIGLCAMVLGDLERASDYFNKGLTVPTPTRLLQRPSFLFGMASIAIIQGRFDEASSYVEQAREFLQARRMAYYVPQVELAGGKLAQARGETDSALAFLRKAEESAATMDMKPLMLQAMAIAARILSDLGRDREAAEKREAALNLASEIGSLIKDDELRGLYLEARSEELA